MMKTLSKVLTFFQLLFYDNFKNFTLFNIQIKCKVPLLPDGKYHILVSHKAYGNLYSSGTTVKSEKHLSGVTPQSGSVYGGQVIRIDGNGFPKDPSHLKILLGTKECLIEGSYGAEGEVYCQTAAQSAGTASFDIQVKEVSANFPSLSYTFSSQHSPSISSISPTNGQKGSTITITGALLNNGQVKVYLGQYLCNTTSVEATKIVCLVPEMRSEVLKVKVLNDYGFSNDNVQFTNDLLINTMLPLEGSFAGGREVVIFGKGFGEGSVVSVCGKLCPSVLVSYSQMTCLLPSYDAYQNGVSTTKTCDVFVDGKLHGNQFVYKDSLTPTLQSVSPRRSGTGGGVSITITGANFASNTNNVKVWIDETVCLVSGASETQIICKTGQSKTTNMAAKVVVKITGKGQAVNKDKSSAHFEYVDVWSSPFTWGGNSPPAKGK